MFEPLSMTLCMGYAALAPYAHRGSAVSAEARVVSSQASSVLSGQQSSQALFGKKSLAISQLYSVVGEIVPDADQKPVAGRALRNAEQLLLAFPDDVPVPELSVDPDGAVAFDWIASRACMLSVSVNASERLAYAWLDGSDRGHGVLRFRNYIVPSQLLALIRTTVGQHAGPALRIA